MTEPLRGISQGQQQELQEMLGRLAALWAELTEAAANQDQDRVDRIQREFDTLDTRKLTSLRE